MKRENIQAISNDLFWDAPIYLVHRHACSPASGEPDPLSVPHHSQHVYSYDHSPLSLSLALIAAKKEKGSPA